MTGRRMESDLEKSTIPNVMLILATMTGLINKLYCPSFCSLLYTYTIFNIILSAYESVIIHRRYSGGSPPSTKGSSRN